MEKLGYKKLDHIYSIKKSCKRFYLKDENIENDIHIFNDEIEITQKNHNFIGPDQTVTITKEELKAILKVMKEGF